MKNIEHCPLCGSAESQFFAAVDEEERPVEYQICLSCSLVYQSPRMTEEELEQYYSDQYMLDHQEARSVTKKELYVQRGRAGEFVDLLKGKVRPGARHLDIGCSAGVLIDELRYQLGSSGQGVEPGEVYRSYCKARGITVYPTIDDVPAADRSFDLITMAHVLEHLPDPVEYLKSLRRDYLSPDGLLLLEVPNLYFHPSLELPHLFAFSPYTLSLTVEMAGFQVLVRRTHGQPRSLLFPFYIMDLARTAPDDFQSASIRGGATKARAFRWLGTRARKLGERFLPGFTWLPVPIDGDR